MPDDRLVDLGKLQAERDAKQAEVERLDTIIAKLQAVDRNDPTALRQSLEEAILATFGCPECAGEGCDACDSTGERTAWERQPDDLDD